MLSKEKTAGFDDEDKVSTCLCEVDVFKLAFKADNCCPFGPKRD